MWVVLILFSSPSEACFPLPPILWRWISWFSQLATRTCSHMTLECLHFCSAQVIPIKIKWSLKCKLWRVCVWKFLSVAIPAERLEACQPAVFPLRGTVAYTVIVYIGLLHKCNMEILFLQWYYNISLAFTCFFFPSWIHSPRILRNLKFYYPHSVHCPLCCLCPLAKKHLKCG